MSKFIKRPWLPLLIVHLVSLCVLLLLQISSSANGAYVEQFLESVEVCTSAAVGPFSSLAKKKIRLGNYPNNTVMIKMTRWNQFWPSFLNFRCKFQVTAPKKYGVMVVIQAMHLRKDKRSSSCRDFIKFEQDDGFQTSQICGELGDEDFSRSPESLLGQRYFHDNKGQIDVTFSTDDKDKDSVEETKPVFLKMIFTAYSDCSDIALSTGRLRRCSALRSHSCIASDLFCDGEVNCGFNEADFGTDERDCDGSGRQGKTSEGSFTDRPASLYVFAITCVATLFVVVILVFVACCCVRRFSSRSQPGAQGPLDHLPPFQEHMEFHMATTGPTVPSPAGERNEKPVEDLPPPYDALFPISELKKK